MVCGSPALSSLRIFRPFRTVKKAVKKNYPKAKVNKVHINKQGQYKLEIGVEDGTSETIFVDKKGKPIDE